MENLQVKALPKEFLLGAATAAYQVEGATRVDGKGINIYMYGCRMLVIIFVNAKTVDKNWFRISIFVFSINWIGL